MTRRLCCPAIENVKDFKGLTGTVTIDPETHMPRRHGYVYVHL